MYKQYTSASQNWHIGGAAALEKPLTNSDLTVQVMPLVASYDLTPNTHAFLGAGAVLRLEQPVTEDIVTMQGTRPIGIKHTETTETVGAGKIGVGLTARLLSNVNSYTEAETLFPVGYNNSSPQVNVKTRVSVNLTPESQAGETNNLKCAVYGEAGATNLSDNPDLVAGGGIGCNWH
jgi:hypothetical protein